MPAFEGLLPQKHDKIVQVLLFRLCEWHTLAKLRLHTETSLKLLGQSLRQLSDQIRKFQSCTCVAFQTVELPNEAAQRQRQEVAELQSGQRTKPSHSGPQCKTFNINTYKFHALGDYVGTIRMFGTTDSYTTQVVSVYPLHRLYYIADIHMKCRVNLLIESSRGFMGNQTRKMWSASSLHRSGGIQSSGGSAKP